MSISAALFIICALLDCCDIQEWTRVHRLGLTGGARPGLLRAARTIDLMATRSGGPAREAPLGEQGLHFMSRFLLEAALVTQFARQCAETFAHADSLRHLPAAECRAHILQTLGEQISTTPAPLECVMRARRGVSFECVDVYLKRSKLAGSLTCSRHQWARLRRPRNRVRPPEHVDQQNAGLAVRELRKARSLSQEEFAYRCGIDRTYLSGIERGRRNVSLRNIELIARKFGMSLSELMKGL